MKNIKINLPEDVKYIIDTLYENGYECYVVGGCVRDSILDAEIHDWDLTTNAKPEEVIKLFNKVIPTGIKYGTVTIVMNKNEYEITTYRKDIGCNGRHAEVEFTNSLKEDLSRRDFTINAMAYNDIDGLIDYFGGLEDIEDKTIKFVGNARERIKEDYLRILRMIRFSVKLGFRIWRYDCDKALQSIDMIKGNVSIERMRDEFNKTIVNFDNTTYNKIWLEEFMDLYGLYDLFYINQNNIYHCYDVLKHTLVSMSYVDNIELKLAMLLHDIGKKKCKIVDDNYIDHFYGHSKESALFAERWLKSFKYDNKTIETIVALIENHDLVFEPSEKFVKRCLNKFGEELFRKLIKVRKADILAQNPKYTLERLDKVNSVEKILDKVIEEGACFTRKNLAVNGLDLIALGFKGKEIGSKLEEILDKVISGELENNKESILKFLKE